jgi:hypothetical protein
MIDLRHQMHWAMIAFRDVLKNLYAEIFRSFTELNGSVEEKI